MSHHDLEILKARLMFVSPDQLRYSYISDSVIPGLQGLHELSRRRAVEEIIRTLNGMAIERRLRGIAWLYCWLLPRTSVQPWFGVRFRDASVIACFDEWLTRMATLMQRDGFRVTMAYKLEEGTMSASFLVRDLADQSQDHQKLFVVMWPGIPVVMMHATEPRLMGSLLRVLSESLDRASMLALDIPPGNLLAGFHSCVSKLGIELSAGTLEIPLLASATGFPGPRIDKEALQQCMQYWNAVAEALGYRVQP